MKSVSEMIGPLPAVAEDRSQEQTSPVPVRQEPPPARSASLCEERAQTRTAAGRGGERRSKH